MASVSDEILANTAGDNHPTPMDLEPISIPLVAESSRPFRCIQPVTVGIPFPRGLLRNRTPLAVKTSRGRAIPVQESVLCRWPDGSIQWLLVDFILESQESLCSELLLESSHHDVVSGLPRLAIKKDGDIVTVRTETATFEVSRSGQFRQRVHLGEGDHCTAASVYLAATSRRGKASGFEIANVSIEESGATRVTIRVDGVCPVIGCEFTSRMSLFAGTSLAKMVLTVRNPRRALHRGGLWDLGDRNSALFKDLYLAIQLTGNGPHTIDFRPEPGMPFQRISDARFEIYQDSSGGENWQSRNHVNRENRVPCSFRGYRIRYGNLKRTGSRANPTVTLRKDQATVSVAVPEFWQQFPKAIEVGDQQLKISLFPRQFDDFHELQGGEQKTHTIWLDFSAPSEGTNPLDWVHDPVRIRAYPEWYQNSQAVPLATRQPKVQGPLDKLLSGLTEGEHGLMARRETVDEYGWRHFGDIYADHEEAYYTGTEPLISHYNNQYDFLASALTQYLQSGEKHWLDIVDPLARHVIDIDIYHTNRDRPQYNGGLFWHTDHYRHAATAAHRCYSRANKLSRNAPYGGGPSCEHSYSTGLLYYHFLTGSVDAREAVIGLANWVIEMDDGRGNLLGLADPGATGFASCTLEPSYHGPGRGSGNSINSLLDGWLLTGKRLFFDKAESLIRRSIHPADDIDERDLLNVERRWSYTVFLVVLARYLTLKSEIGQIDFMYAYARASLLAYAKWMLEFERPYFDQRDKLEFPTETWAAHDLRKANVLLLAARHADNPLYSPLLSRGRELAERAWSDLCHFESRYATRAIALALAEGHRQQFLESVAEKREPRPTRGYDFGLPERFVGQRDRVRNSLRSLVGVAGILLRLSNPGNWWRYYFAN